MEPMNNVLFVSLSEFDAYKRESIFNNGPFQDRIQLEFVNNSHDTMQYIWQLRTKYYVASVGVHWITEPDPNNSKESSLFKVLQAVILLVDSKNPNSIKSASKWASFCNDLDLSVKIMACPPYDTEHANNFERDIECWSAENDFELVHIPVNIDDQVGDFNAADGNETFGVCRIIEALECCRWTHVSYKEVYSLDPNNGEYPCMEREDTEFASNRKTNDCTSDSAQKRNLYQNNASVDIFNDAKIEAEDYETLFSRMEAMKRYANSLPHELRKEYAAKVALAFWNAIGASDEEIDDI